MADINSIWFWQVIISPHMGALAVCLAEKGFSVTFVANSSMSVDRAAQGWEVPALGNVRFELASTSAEIVTLVNAAPADSVHLCQGLRGNAIVGQTQRKIYQRGLRQWIIMETVDDAGWAGLIKRALYRSLFLRFRYGLDGVLAIGHDTPNWVVARGMPRSHVFPFAYFLRDPESGTGLDAGNGVEAFRFFRLIFVGQLIERKRIDILIKAIAALDRTDIDLWVVGTGKLNASLQAQAMQLLPGRVKWLGVRPISEVAALIAEADCLVLPSRHDGWGAVVSEALMVGTPAICSDACGASEIVLASQDGGVFPAGDVAALTDCLDRQIERGVIGKERRRELADWARCLGARAGAVYLAQLLQHRYGKAERPVAPWTIPSGISMLAFDKYNAEST